jgi:hypothetical protein
MTFFVTCERQNVEVLVQIDSQWQQIPAMRIRSRPDFYWKVASTFFSKEVRTTWSRTAGCVTLAKAALPLSWPKNSN